MSILKKISGAILALSLIMNIIPVSVNASEEAPVLPTEEEINSQLNVAIESGEQPCSTATLQNQETGLTYNVDVYEIPLDEQKTYTDINYADTVIYVASTDKMSVNPDTILLTTYADGSMSDSAWDETGSAHMYLGFDFNRNAYNEIQLTYVWGNISLNSNITVTNNSVLAKQFSPYNGVNEIKNLDLLSSQATSFNFHTGFTKWVPDTSASIFGVKWFVELQRGSKWGFNFPLYKHML